MTRIRLTIHRRHHFGSISYRAEQGEEYTGGWRRGRLEIGGPLGGLRLGVRGKSGHFYQFRCIEFNIKSEPRGGIIMGSLYDFPLI